MSKKDYIDVLHLPIAKTLCHISVPQRAPKTKKKPKRKSQLWASSGFRK